MERLNKTKYVLEIYKAKCYKLLMSSVFVVWLLNEINELELSFFVILSFNRKDKKGKICLQKNNNILRWYHIFVHFDIQRKMLLTFNEFCFRR